MDAFAKNNGISEKEMHRIKSMILAEKVFALKESRKIPTIDKKMMTEIYDGALAGRTTVNSDSAWFLLSNFNQFQGVSITA